MAQYKTPTVDKSAFEIPDEQGMEQQGKALTDKTNAIDYDWSSVDNALGKLHSASQGFEQRAGGENLASKTDAKLAQNSVGEGFNPMNGGMASQAQKATGQQGLDVAAQTARNVAAEQLGNAQMASQLRRTQIDAQMAKQAQEIQLDQAKFGITQNISQAVSGLKNAQATFTNAYNNLVATAKNGTDATNINAHNFNVQQAFSYVGAALSSASGIASGIGANLAKPGDPSASAGPQATGGLTQADVDYANQMRTQGYVSGTTPGRANTKVGENDFASYLSFVTK